jgi:ubiquinone/menaquinone biosynthesis C-methylase UbiE
MQSTTFPFSPLPLQEAAYRSVQWGKSLFAFWHRTSANRLLSRMYEARPNPQTLIRLQKRYQALIDQDWQDANQGYYPVSLLFDDPWQEFAWRYPQVWLDMIPSSIRIAQKQYQVFSSSLKTGGYPKYYLQNFHFQTDGYLSDQSANLYDLQVELLFGGSADPMRRRVIPPLKEALGSRVTQSLRILDVACGTGRTLRMLRQAFPEASLYGVDLSPAYLRKALQVLTELPGELPQLIQANAEDLPYASELFDAVVSVFLFHELPGVARQGVLNQISRVLKPGGIVVLCDSMQMADSPELAELMEAFPKAFHEPYYRDYTQDDLVARLEQVGCEVFRQETHHLSHYWIARKRETVSLD